MKRYYKVTYKKKRKTFETLAKAEDIGCIQHKYKCRNIVGVTMLTREEAMNEIKNGISVIEL